MKRRAGKEAGNRIDVDVDAIDRALGDECEALLSGRYLSWLLTEGLPVPGWAWLNRAAHAPLAEITRHVQELGVPDQPCCFPHAALLIEAMIVAEVAPDDLPELQRTVLVPLELDMVARTCSPRAATEQVNRALHPA